MNIIKMMIKTKLDVIISKFYKLKIFFNGWMIPKQNLKNILC